MRLMQRRSSHRRRNYPLPFINPPRRAKRRKAATARRSRHHSPAMRAKISRAVKAAMRRRSGGGMVVHRRRPVRRHSYAIARRRSYAPARRSNRIVMGRLLNPRGGRRMRRRSFRRRNPVGGLAGIKSMLNSNTLAIAGGAITGSVATGWVLGKYGSMLPGSSSKFGPAIYQLAIPMTGAYFLRRKYPRFAEGLVIGGVIMAITTIMKSGLAGASAAGVVQGPLGNFYTVKPMGLAGELGTRPRSMGTYIGPRTFNTIPAAVNTPVFGSGAWG